jgi:hypothetical protein
LLAPTRTGLHGATCRHDEGGASPERVRTRRGDSTRKEDEELELLCWKVLSRKSLLFFWFALKLGRRHSWWGKFGEGKKIKSAEYDVRFGVMSNILERK